MTTTAQITPADFDVQTNIAALAVMTSEMQTDLAEAVKKLEKVFEDAALEPDTQKLDAILTATTAPDTLGEATHTLVQEALALLRVVHAEQVVEATKPSWWRPGKHWLWPALPVLTCACGIALGGLWWRPSAGDRAWVQLGAQLDHALVGQYGTLPAPLQGIIGKIYSQCGIQPPGERRGKRA